MRALQYKLWASRAASVHTPRELLVMIGRVALWLAIGMLLIRGAGAVLAPAQDTRGLRAARAVGAPAWPDDAARALAVEFATAYLTHTPGERPDAVAGRLTGLAAPQLAGELAPRFAHDAPAQEVRSATVERAVRTDAQHALITVAMTLANDRRLLARRLSVPVARDASGRLVVDDLPSFVAAPARARVEVGAEEPLSGEERGAIEDVLTRFLRAYLAGDGGALAYLIAPGARLTAADGRLQLVSLASVVTRDGAGSAGRGRRVVLVTVRARDVVSGALYLLRYRVALVRRDRWYVAELNGEGGAR